MQHAHAHTAFLCSGEVWPATGGSWIGHVLPGVFLVAWGLHWFISATHSSLTGGPARGRSRGASHLRAPFLPPRLQDVEALLKVVLPAVAIVLEFSLSGTRYLRCPPGTAKTGELDVAHMNSWSHATNYPPIILSGLVDLIHTLWLPLPPGVPHFFLGAAFGSSGFLMLAHTKGQPLDALLHQLLGACMVAVALLALVQACTLAGRRGRRSYGLEAARSLAVIIEGCWFWAITHIMFSQDTTWQASQPGDMTPTMFVPVLFTWVLLGVITSLLLLYLAMHFILVGPQQHPARHGQHSKHHAEHAPALGPAGGCSSKVPGLPASSSGEESDDGNDGGLSPSSSPSCCADSCCDWRGCRSSCGSPGVWKYAKLGPGQHQHQQQERLVVVGQYANMAATSPAARSIAGTDTGVELV